MLTDYHLHLRPDEDGHAAGALLHRGERRALPAAAAAAGIEELGVSEHVYRFTPGARALAPPVLGGAGARRPRRLLRVRPRRRRCGSAIECDFVPGAEDRTANLLEARDFDYVVGSVHFVGERGGRPRGLGRLGGAAATPTRSGAATSRRSPSAPARGLFDILAHPDLVKVWGGARPLPERDPRHFYEPAVEAIAESGIAVEVSTAGLRKPVGELYPSRAFAEMCVEAGAAFALSSDAHLPEQVGFGYERALEFLGELGVGEICVFERRERRLEPLGSRGRRES